MIPMTVSPARVARRGRLALVTAALVLSLALPAAAQDSDLRSLSDQVERLQRELSDLQRTVYAGAPAPAGSVAGGDGSNLDASQEVRLQQIESQMTGLTGQIEELNFHMTLAEAVGALARGEPSSTGQSGQPMAEGAGSAAPAATAEATPPGATAQQHTLQAQLEAAESGTSLTPPAATSEQQPQQLTPPQTAAAAPSAAYQLPGNTPDEQYQYAFGLLRQANYPEAEQALRAFIDRNPASPLAGNAQYWLGETYYVRGDYQNAAVAFAEGYKKYPDSGKAPDNLLKLGMSLGEIGAKNDACTAFGQLAKQFPGAPANIKERAERERTRLGCG